MKKFRTLLVTLALVVMFPLAAWAHSTTHNHSCTPHALVLDGFRSKHRVIIGSTWYGAKQEYHDHYTLGQDGQWRLMHTVAGIICW